ncbi:transcriptional regulator [Pedobacter psychrodurus]|uniref:Transcriptional regulator n=1 Tax=Pedobacter psychrodurus TaxID=2530456 RepID=A0A4R0PTB2_9SPHI|nr:SatD family protein [Pedobacter psychrodurus]TCD24752.1 transcriptional regulator [Pedobacter psychrodurus]
MICIITGDIVGSRKIKDSWLLSLKTALKIVSDQNSKWEIYRGDSFQVEVEPEKAIRAAAYLKACIRVNKPADVRMGIGIGDIKNKRKKLSESSGDAFVNSGAAFDSLKQAKVNLAIKTDSADFDEEINVLIKLSLISMDSWGVVAAEMVKLALENNNLLQSELAAISGRTQSSVSEALKRAHYTEIMEMDRLYRKKLNQLILK